MVLRRFSSKWGYVTESGDFAIPPQFDEATDFDTDLASVTVSARVGLIDRNGTFVVTPQFDQIGPFADGLAAVWVGAKRRGNDRLVWIYGAEMGVR